MKRIKIYTGYELRAELKFPNQAAWECFFKEKFISVADFKKLLQKSYPYTYTTKIAELELNRILK